MHSAKKCFCLPENQIFDDFSTSTHPTPPTAAKPFPTARPALQAQEEDRSMEYQNAQLALHRNPASTPALGLINGTIAQGRLVAERDDRSSSLSDIDDGADQEEPAGNSLVPGQALAENDSEAETERLENSPLKLRKHKNVVLSSNLQGHEQSLSNLTQRSDDEQRGYPEEESLMEEIVDESAAMSGTSRSIGDVGPSTTPTTLLDSFRGAIMAPSPPEVAGKKRKRTSPRSRDIPEGIENREMTSTQNGAIKVELNGNSALNQPTLSDRDIEESQREVDDATASEVELEQTDDEGKAGDNERDKVLPTKVKKGKTGKRKGKKLRDGSPGDMAQVNAMAIDEGYGVENGHALDLDNVDEGEEIGAAEGDGEEAEADVAARTEEELVKKRTAMDSLGAIEKHFAAFRDKLYDERVAQLTSELALLTQSSPNHPDYLAMIQCLDQRRDEKIQHEQILLHYKLKALETKSIAERSQLHSQYFQTVRAVRERKLEEVGEQWYQIQRDRRGWEGSGNVSDFTYKFPTRRSHQITQQTAYNLEVSILSGVAKYVGFPAAPAIDGARSSEVDEDFKSMGIKPQFKSTIRNHHASQLHAAPSTASFSRTKPAAEEQFLEQNAWANPQHPVHQQLQQLAQRQISHQSQAGSSLTTPAAQRRIVDLSAPKGSASTIADESSAPSSSAAATPIGTAQGQNRLQADRRVVTDPDLPFTQARVASPTYGAVALSEGEISPIDTRKRCQGDGLQEHPSATHEPPGAFHQNAVPVSSSIFSSTLSTQTAASRPGTFNEHLSMASSSRPSSAAKAEEMLGNPRTPPTVSLLQPPQGSVITAGA
ncbi:MAG: hypothetical protein M1830_001418, partial [Pleopsidium flavum]